MSYSSGALRRMARSRSSACRMGLNHSWSRCPKKGGFRNPGLASAIPGMQAASEAGTPIRCPGLGCRRRSGKAQASKGKANGKKATKHGLIPHRSFSLHGHCFWALDVCPTPAEVRRGVPSVQGLQPQEAAAEEPPHHSADLAHGLQHRKWGAAMVYGSRGSWYLFVCLIVCLFVCCLYGWLFGCLFVCFTCLLVYLFVHVCTLSWLVASLLACLFLCFLFVWRNRGGPSMPSCTANQDKSMLLGAWPKINTFRSLVPDNNSDRKLIRAVFCFSGPAHSLVCAKANQLTAQQGGAPVMFPRVPSLHQPATDTSVHIGPTRDVVFKQPRGPNS